MIFVLFLKNRIAIVQFVIFSLIFDNIEFI